MTRAALAAALDAVAVLAAALLLCAGAVLACLGWAGLAEWFGETALALARFGDRAG